MKIGPIMEEPIGTFYYDYLSNYLCCVQLSGMIMNDLMQTWKQVVAQNSSAAGPLRVTHLHY
jgi:hypothetical protein